MKLLEYSIIIALVSAFVLVLLDKWGIKDWMQVHGNKFFSKMAGCNFCLGFWISVIIALIMTIITQNAIYLFVPFISSPITRFIL